MVQKVGGEMLKDDALANITTEFTPNSYLRVDAGGALEERTPTEVRTDIAAQPLDATLTALAGQNWAADSLPVGSGADTVGQVALAANQFLAKSSAGAAGAKSITDFALSMLDDSSATTVLATLGIVGGTYTPTITNVANVDSTTANLSFYLRVGDLVFVFGYLDVDPTAAASTLTQVRISLPVASNLQALADLTGVAAGNSVNESGLILANTANDAAALNFLSATTASHAMSYVFGYRIR